MNKKGATKHRMPLWPFALPLQHTTHLRAKIIQVLLAYVIVDGEVSLGLCLGFEILNLTRAYFEQIFFVQAFLILNLSRCGTHSLNNDQVKILAEKENE